MFSRIDAPDIGALMQPISRRGEGRGVYFVRLCTGGTKVMEGLWAYHEAARAKGIIIEGQIANPDDRQLSYLNETLGSAFRPEAGFILAALEKWMPRMSTDNRKAFTDTLMERFAEMRANGKPEGVLKNIYFKLMCWLYYRFERLMPYLGDDDPPRILYVCDAVTNHELTLLRMLNEMGADILLLEPKGDAGYLKQDPASRFSQLLYNSGDALPPSFTLKEFRKQHAQPVQAPSSVSGQSVRMQTAPSNTRTGTQIQPSPIIRAQQPQNAKIDPENYFQAPTREPCTNAWMKEAAYTQLLTSPELRGDDFRLFYNGYIRISGVPDKATYANDMFLFYQQLRKGRRNIVVVDRPLPQPDPDAIAKIRRRNYRTAEELIVDIAGNLPACANIDLQRTIQRSFVQVMMAAAHTEPDPNKLVVSAVYVICWIRQYQSALFQGYKGKEIPCFIYNGGCRNQHEAMYISCLARMPVDVMVLAPDKDRKCVLTDDKLLDLEYADSMKSAPFPCDTGTLQMQTVASHAENDLTSVLYNETGLYRNRQFASAAAITLRTTYDEIFILWDQELKYRPNFSTTGQMVNMPVIYAKVSGVEHGKVTAYWQKMKLLLGPNTYFIDHLPHHLPGEANPYHSLSVKALKNGMIRRETIKADRQYPFSLIRDELQEHIFDKLQLMLDRKLIKGTFVNGTEYTVVATVLNMRKDIVRMLQSFDFTKKNPKIVCLNTRDQTASLEDSIMLTFLNLIGFDIVIFVPTGYQAVENYLNDNYPVEHQVGDYLYDLNVPDMKNLPPEKHSWIDSIFKRGN